MASELMNKPLQTREHLGIAKNSAKVLSFVHSLQNISEEVKELLVSCEERKLSLDENVEMSRFQFYKCCQGHKVDSYAFSLCVEAVSFDKALNFYCWQQKEARVEQVVQSTFGETISHGLITMAIDASDLAVFSFAPPNTTVMKGLVLSNPCAQYCPEFERSTVKSQLLILTELEKISNFPLQNRLEAQIMSLWAALDIQMESKDLFASDQPGIHEEKESAKFENMISTQEPSIDNLPKLSDLEVQQQLIDWNTTECAHPHEMLVHEMFEDMTRIHPDSVALVFEDQQITYRALNDRANEVAWYLRSEGIGLLEGKRLVGLGMDRSIEMVVAILGVLKAGGAYVPLDLAHPDNRLAYILSDTRTTHVLTQAHLVERWNSIRSLVADIPEFKIVPIHTCRNFAAQMLDKISVSDLAYIIYTSGTTGNPKGVMIAHASLKNYLHSLMKLFPLDVGETVLQRSSISFDVSVHEVLLPLCSGATGILCNEEERKNVVSMIKLIHKYHVSLVDLTPALLSTILSQEGMLQLLHSWRVIFVGGEALSENTRNLCCLKLTKAKLYNSYGPTETTVAVTYAPMTNEEGPVVLGKPLYNTQFYVLQEETMCMLPVGCVGELYIGGDCLAVGYLNRRELTTERFIWHKFPGTHEPCRLYKTGDLVKYLPDGNLVYIGRADNQVKIRGYRIELEEIETRLMEFDAVSSAAVLVKGSGVNQCLVAYVTGNRISEESTETFLSRLRSNLESRLPSYMIPSSLQVIEKMPLNINGKVDRKALLILENSQSEETIAMKLPSQEVSDENRNPEVESFLIESFTNLFQLKLSGHSNASLIPSTNIWQYGLNSISIPVVAHNMSENFGVPANLCTRWINGSQTIIDIVVLVTRHLCGLAQQPQKSSAGSVQNIASVVDHCNWENIATEDMKWRPLRSISSFDDHNKTWADEIKVKDQKCLLITGVTGFLGSVLLLDTLKNAPANIHVYVIVRAKDHREAKERVLKQLSQINGSLSIDLNLIHCLAGDLSQPFFGLTNHEYERLSITIDTVIHNAASTSWKASYFQLRPPNVLATKEILKFCYHSSPVSNNKLKKLCYVSTISASIAENDDLLTADDYQKVISSIMNRQRTLAEANGYTISKAIAEYLVRVCAEQLELPACIFRLGTIAAHSTGYSNKTDFITRLLSSIYQTRTMPIIDGTKISGTIELTSVDAISLMIRQYMNRTKAFDGAVISLENPKATTFVDILNTFKLTLHDMHITIQEIDLMDWLDRIRMEPSDPLYHLLDMVEGMLSGPNDQCCKNAQNFEHVQDATNHHPYPTLDLNNLSLAVQWIIKYHNM